MDQLVKCAYLMLTNNGLPVIPGLINFVVWELRDYKGISVQICILGVLVLGNCLGILVGTVSIIIESWYFGVGSPCGYCSFMLVK